ncbi:alanine racemase [Phytohabitans houttuyneae]|uniref:Alanine racemase n=1 Tax=Phytohabitans houttuyneae TaxID=1076126 RepID=A0A6V8K9A6_9ACTN|nr:alanine racemase [Phytohabitans houttuyneae]GFJ81782.1 alanine racemase [Phytohabitans houttuyneae]
MTHPATATVLAPHEPRGEGARLTVDLNAVAHNVRLLRRRTAAELMAVVKADGFGHGAVDVARTAIAAGAGWLGVTSVDEAAALRDAGLRVPVLSWLNPVDADFDTAVRRCVDLAVPSRDHLDAIARADGLARVHLHLDTGMARDGAEPGAWLELCRRAYAAEREGRIRVVGVMGHLACAETPGHPANAAGRRLFEWGVAAARDAGLRPAVRHLAASAAALTEPRAHFDLVRVGAALVGIDPTGTTALRTALTLAAPVVAVRRVAAGTPVGYGHAWHAPAATTLGLVPVGYGDGLPRHAWARAEVQVRGRRRRIAGRISMDQLVVDLGDDPVRPGETATVFGPGGGGEPTLQDWAGWADTIAHELVTGLGPRLRRHVLPADNRDPHGSLT